MNLSNMVTQYDFLSSLVAKLKDPVSVEELTATITTVRDKLVLPGNLRVMIGTNINKIPNPLDPWKNFKPVNW